MLKSHILTQNHCEYALTTLEESPENIKLPRPAEISKSLITKTCGKPVIKSGESPKSTNKNKAETTKNVRKSARNVEKQKKEMEKKADEEKTEKPERTKIEYSGINKFRFGSGSNPVSPTTPTKTKLQDTNKTANMQNAPAKVQNNQLLLTPPKNLRKLSKDYSPNSIEKETKSSRTPDRAGSAVREQSVRGEIGIDVSPNVSLKEPKVVLERTGLRTRNKTVRL